MAERAKVSVIVPVFNVEPYLVECMESIINQTLKEMEIICVNDGSTDRSPEILHEYAKKDSRIIVIDKPNGGYGHAMNCGLDRATGEYIGIVEPDDYVDLNMYKDLYELAVKHDVDLIKADFHRFAVTAGELDLQYNALDKSGKSYNRVINPYDQPEILRFIMNTWSGIYKKSFLEEYHIRHQETPGASFQDNGFWFQTFTLAQRVYFVDRPYYMNRRDNPNSSVHNKAKVYCMNDEYAHIHEFMEAHPELKKRFMDEYTRKRYYNYQFTYGRVGDEYKIEYIQRFAEEFKQAEKLGELNEKVFTPFAWEQLQFIMNDPVGYHYYCKFDVKELEKEIRVQKKKVRTLRKRIKNLKASKTYKIGQAVTYLPKKIKEKL